MANRTYKRVSRESLCTPPLPISPSLSLFTVNVSTGHSLRFFVDVFSTFLLGHSICHKSRSVGLATTVEYIQRKFKRKA